MENPSVEQARVGYQAYTRTTIGGNNSHHSGPHQPKAYYIPPPKVSRPIPIVSRGRPIYKATTNTVGSSTPTTNTYHPESSISTPRTSFSYSKQTRVREYDPTPTSRYIHMLLSIDSIPKIYNLLAAFFTWILLAGYVLLPGTFTKLNSNLPSTEASKNEVEKWIVGAIKNTPLLYIAVACSVIGVIGMAGLWARWRKNYVWIINRIFLPGALNSLAGIISTIVNVYTAQDGKFSLTAIVTITVTASSTLINGVLFYVYNNWALARVQELHRKEYFERAGDIGSVGNCELGESGELVEVEKSKE